MYELTKNPDEVLRRNDDGTTTTIPRGHRFWDEYQAWLAAGNVARPISPPFIPYTPEHFRFIRDQAWAWMTDVIKARRYDSVESCCSYANSTVPRYKAEALAMIAWRDDINVTLENLVTQLPAGITTWEQVRELLPQPQNYNWPGNIDLPFDIEGPVQMNLGL